ncbi:MULTISPECIES: DUF6245 family protein [unclassified Streptomyces]|uniref:DUF6245 family protein n=1 Tax=unclassified Streptomyces TaxID=2593676 RepID=UPI0011B9365E|nr:MULTISPECIES: DUF6245 family protein [unclassified Streptomyces]MYT74240.1 hypothetical protein [Streptomyces sp. SID8367]
MTAHDQPHPAPGPDEIAAAMTALGVYAQQPDPEELERQAVSVGGEHVLAAVLANALYGASIGTGMVTEGNMLEAGAGSEEMALAREQVFKASGADWTGVIGLLHWQTGHVWNALKTMSEEDHEPLGTVGAHASNALLNLLSCMSVTGADDPRAADVPADLERVRADLVAAVEALDALPVSGTEVSSDGTPGV